jgi:hypothetical protein
VSDEPTVKYKPYVELLKDNKGTLSNNKETFAGIEVVDNILKVLGAVLEGLSCKNKVTVATFEL